MEWIGFFNEMFFGKFGYNETNEKSVVSIFWGHPNADGR